MPCLLRLPVNADTTLVALCRPITFLSAVVFALGAFAYSTFLNVSGLAPIECRCPNADKGPRTRPRPRATPPRSPSSPPPPPEPSAIDSLSSFSSFVAASFRPRRPPPVARRGSHNKTLGGYPVHQLDDLVEEEDMDPVPTTTTTTTTDRPDTDGEDPGLTPDVSEGEETASVETVDDPPYRRTNKPRAVAFFGGFKWKRRHSDDGTASPVSPSDEVAAVSPPKSAFKHSPTGSTRPRSATSSTTTSSGSTRSVHFSPRRQTSLDSVSSTDSIEPTPAVAVVHPTLLRSRKPLSINTSTSSPSSQHATAQSRSLFTKPSFRSLSPLSRSPATTPDPSPPSSPRVGPSSGTHTSATAGAPCLIAKHLATRLARSHSLDSASSGRPRGRSTRSLSPLPDPAAALRLRRGVTLGHEGRLGLDSTGSSDLRLDDFSSSSRLR
ncbi:hypothetical protein JCM3766R1_003138 [Sporobolomyces carnicolor]